jgi:hypothetical protein
MRAILSGTTRTLVVVGATLIGVAFLQLHAAQLQGPPSAPAAAAPQREGATAASDSPNRALLSKYCFTCHNQRAKTGGLALDTLDVSKIGDAPAVWEKVVWKLRGGMMPPIGRPRPDHQAIEGFASWLEGELDRTAVSNLDPGRIPQHRLNRAEYANAIRDLLALEIDGPALLPADDSGHGFDNLAGTLAVSPSLLERYMAAARRISRLAVGDPSIGPGLTSKAYVVPINMVQDDRMSEDLPFGSRGGLAIRHSFPLDGEYVIKISLKKSVYEYIVNIEDSHDLDVRLDGSRVAHFKVGGEAKGKAAPLSFSGTFMAAGGAGFPTQEWDDYMTSADAGFKVRLAARAGTHTVSVSFVGKSWEKEGVLQPPLREYGATVTEVTDAAPRPEGPGIGSVTIEGPYDPNGPGETPSRRRLFVCVPTAPSQETGCARKILSTLARRAFRRPVTDSDLEPLMAFYRDGRGAGAFDAGIQSALERVLIDPEFLFRIERDPAGAAPHSIHRLTDVELASRMAFFLWSSIPDDELLDVAVRGKLNDPKVIERQVRRMLADSRSQALVSNFFGQWLMVRNLRGVAPDPNLFPEFDENLREAFQQETELFVASQLREDRSVLDLLRADYTFLNERLARHYQVPGVTGSRFRRVTLSDDKRGGLLGQGSILTVTSYGNRTSPVLRAKWVLENLLGTPPPPPPGNVPPFPDERGANGEPRSVRERLSQHRKNPVCASCHAPMDPLGFALENFDAVGKWRNVDANAPVDSSGVLVDGTGFTGPAELRQVLLNRREQVVHTAAEKLLTYALGRGLEYYDAPAVRRIVREAAPSDYRWSSIILGVIKSPPFQMRRSES